MSYIERPAVTGDPYYSSEYVIEYGYEPSSWLMFAGLLVFFTGLWNLIEGTIALFRSTYFTGHAVFGTLAFWSLVWFAVGLLQIVAGYGIMGGRTWARYAGIAIVIISTIVNMLTIPLYPWWSMFVVAIDILILYALTVRWKVSVEG